MSKIQKALGKLGRDVRSFSESGSPEPAGDEERIAARNDPQTRKLTRRRYSLPSQSPSEAALKYSINVDLEKLEELGYRRVEEDAEVLRQQFRRIKRPILNIAFGDLGSETENSNVVMVASALPKSGKTFCSINLAISISRERDIGAVLVDADVLKPSASGAFNIETRVGLIDYLLDKSISLEDILVGTDLHDIVVVPAGRQHEDATELLASLRMEQFVHELSSRFQTRTIIVDTPPLLLTNEAQVLSEHMGQIVFVIDAGTTSQEAVASALATLNREKPINAILNRVRGSAGGDYSASYGGEYYGYYSAGGDRNEK